MMESLSQIEQKSALAEAFRYSLNRWDALCRYTQDGRVEIDKAMISYCTSLAGLSWAGNLRVH